MHTLLQGFNISDCDWLAPHGRGAHSQSRVSVSDSLKRLELVQDFIFWYFDEFLVPLLKVRLFLYWCEVYTELGGVKANFYITERLCERSDMVFDES